MRVGGLCIQMVIIDDSAVCVFHSVFLCIFCVPSKKGFKCFQRKETISA